MTQTGDTKSEREPVAASTEVGCMVLKGTMQHPGVRERGGHPWGISTHQIRSHVPAKFRGSQGDQRGDTRTPKGVLPQIWSIQGHKDIGREQGGPTSRTGEERQLVHGREVGMVISSGC